ncbi:hypothetical protein Tco_1298569, partial [Tanacetum coccineum]
IYLLLLVVVAAVRAYGTEELALNHLLEQNPNENQVLTAPVADNVTAPVADNVGSTSGVGEGSSSAANETTQNGDPSGFKDEMDRDVEMEDELTEDLQSEDAFSDYDVELTRESEAIDEYLALVSV